MLCLVSMIFGFLIFVMLSFVVWFLCVKIIRMGVGMGGWMWWWFIFFGVWLIMIVI